MPATNPSDPKRHDEDAAPTTISDQNHEETHPDLEPDSATEDNDEHRRRTDPESPDQN